MVKRLHTLNYYYSFVFDKDQIIKNNRYYKKQVVIINIVFLQFLQLINVTFRFIILWFYVVNKSETKFLCMSINIQVYAWRSFVHLRFLVFLDYSRYFSREKRMALDACSDYTLQILLQRGNKMIIANPRRGKKLV